jgi:hypothetical protein
MPRGTCSPGASHFSNVFTEYQEMQYRLIFETSDLEPIDDYDVFEHRAQAFAAFHAAVADSPDDIASVYLVEDDGEIATVIASHYYYIDRLLEAGD